MILISAIRQGKLQDIVRSFGATGNKGEHNGIEEDTFILMSATRQGHVQGGQRRLQAKEKRAQWNRGGDLLILISATRQGQVQGKGKLQAKE